MVLLVGEVSVGAAPQLGWTLLTQSLATVLEMILVSEENRRRDVNYDLQEALQ